MPPGAPGAPGAAGMPGGVTIPGAFMPGGTMKLACWMPEPAPGPVGSLPLACTTPESTGCGWTKSSGTLWAIICWARAAPEGGLAEYGPIMGTGWPQGPWAPGTNLAPPPPPQLLWGWLGPY